ncbi:MAG: PBP1A family penicillin-binding protein [Lachnospiraceae bacterium]|nr:PBP1A family penicillin-binding protein [Lachnospiraceae bacterium]
MNYGKKSAQKQSEKLSGKRAKNKKRFGITFIKTVLVCILCIIAVGVVGGGLYAVKLIKQCPDISEVNISPNGFSTTVYDSAGNEIETLAASGSNRTYVTIDEIPKDLQHAFVAIEDERFYKHNGIDLRGIIRAGFTGIISGGEKMQGASTITQQLLKNNYFTTWTSEHTLKDSINRKVQEQYLAVQLEKVEDKDTILENYLNTINLGQNTLGVEAASERYFNKSVSELTLSEDAAIAAITQNPSKYNPITNPKDNATRRKKVLKKMLELGYIKQAEYDEALEDNLYDRIQIVNAQAESSASTSYFVDALTDEVAKDLMDQKGYTEAQAYQMLYSGGLTINSTQDSAIQTICEEEVNNNANYSDHVLHSFSYRLTVTKKDGSYQNYSEQTMLTYYQAQNPNYDINFSSEEECKEAIEKYKSEIMEEGDTIADGGEKITYTLQPQAAISVIDQATGHVVALVGGRGDKMASKTLNRATNITRQPGSCFKIVGCYAAALDAGGLTLASVQDDAPTSYANGTPLHNYDNKYRGFTTIRDAIISSMNVVTVKNLTQIGTGLGFEYAEALGISTLEPGDNNQTLCLGGLTHGVTDLELTASYATIANGGDYNKPVLYTQVLDHNGNVLLDNTQNTSKEVLKETTAWLLTNAMQDVITSGTGSGAGLPNMPTAGKTGTTTKNRDTVFAGYTPYYTAAVWGGYDDNTEQTYTAYSKLIWHSVMQRIHENLPRKEFTQPSGIVTATVCKKSGKLAIEGVCDADPRGSMVYTEYFDKDSVPTETCDHHVKVDICSASGQIAGEYCPVENRVPTVYIIGGTAETEDGPYLITEEALNTVCSVHTSSSSSSERGTTEGAVKPSVEGTITENKPQTETSGGESSTGGSSGGSSGGASGGSTGGSSGDTSGTGTNTPSTQNP